MGKTFYFHVSGLNKAPCSPSRQTESLLPVPGEYAGGFCYKIMFELHTKPTLSCLSRRHSTKPHVECQPQPFHKCSCRACVPLLVGRSCRVWPSTRVSAPVGRGAKKISFLGLTVRIIPGSDRGHTSVISNTKHQRFLGLEAFAVASFCLHGEKLRHVDVLFS